MDRDDLLTGGVQKSNWDDIPMANPIQSYIDNNQSAIESLSETNPLRYAAQVPQDVANSVAHPIQYAQNTFNYFKENPMRLNPGYLAGEQVGNMFGQLVTQPLNKSLAQVSGSLLGGAMVGAATGSFGRLKQPTLKTTVDNVAYKPNYPIRTSLGGDAVQFNPNRNTLGFYADLLSKTGMSKKQARNLIAQSIKRNAELPEGRVGGYNTLTSKINIAPNSKIQQYNRSAYDVATHEGAHQTLKRLEALESAGLNNPETSEFLYKLKQSQSNKLFPLAENEAISRAFEILRNPNLRFQELDGLMINPKDVTNAYNVLQPYYRTYGGL